jgi:hypothetical protein
VAHKMVACRSDTGAARCRWDKNDLVNENRETVLMHAASHGETAVVKWLLDIGKGRALARLLGVGGLGLGCSEA